MTETPRGCVFCGGTPLTNQHLWPDWARRQIADIDTHAHRQILEVEGREDVTRVWNDRAYRMTVNAVCGTCNNGWMSGLETDAAEFLRPMIEGRGRALHQGGQTKLASWAFLTALMFSYTGGRDQGLVVQSQVDEFYARRVPPENTRIWMTAFAGDYIGAMQCFGADTDTTQDTARGHRDIYGVAFTFEKTAFNIVGTTRSGLLDGSEFANPRIRQIWPFASSFEWTPKPALDDAGFHSFADAFLRQLPR